MGERLFEWIVEKAMPWVFIIFFAGILIFLPIGGYLSWKESKQPTLTLRKDQWACTQSQQIPTTIYIKTGEVMVPMTTYNTVCNQWSKQ